MHQKMVVDGQILSPQEVKRLLDMVRKDAQEYAGQFFDQCRSAKFRSAWRDVGFRLGRDPQRCFVDQQWGHFVEHVRKVYAEMLTNEKVSEQDKYRIHQALIVQATLGAMSQDSPVQMAPGTQAFEGEKYENNQIARDFGTHADPAMVKRLLTASTLTKH